MGPTASGKTDLAVQLVKQGVQGKQLEIISVDSALVYRGMDIGTAKPDQALLDQAPHRLINCCEPTESYSAARFREDALREMQDIIQHGAIPLLVGGTMLYFRALEQGLSILPEADPELRKKLDALTKEKGAEYMHERLRQIDPQSAERIHPNDPQRIQRALEVFEISGETMSALYQQQKTSALDFSVFKLAIQPEDRSVLHKRIEQRFALMLENGFIDEVRHFFERDDMHADLPSMRAVGYRQVWDYLDKKQDRQQMQERAVAATRQFAKRQLTWLRSDSEINWFDSLDEKLFSRVLKFLNSVTI